MPRARSFAAALPSALASALFPALVAGAASLSLAAASPAAAGVVLYGVDPYHSQAIILVDHFGVSRMGGMFGGLTGTIEFDPEKRSDWKVDVTIPVFNFISTHPPRTDAVKGELLLDATNYPDIKFKATKAESKDGAVVLVGDMTIRSTTKEVSIPMTVRGPRPDPLGGIRVGFEGEVVVSRAAFGIPFDRTMKDGVPVIGDEVTIMFQIEGIQAGRGITRNPFQPPADKTGE